MQPDGRGEKIDWTPFWLGWKVSCSIDICKTPEFFRRKCRDASAPGINLQELSSKAEQVAELARRTEAEYNREMVALVKSYHDGDPEGSPSDLSGGTSGGFQELEIWLYRKNVLRGDGEQDLPGKPFKDYLYQDIATRPGGMAKNLNGCLKKILTREILRNSLIRLKKERVVTISEREVSRRMAWPRTRNEEDGTPVDKEMSSEDLATCRRLPTIDIAKNRVYRPIALDMEIRDVANRFSEFLQAKEDEWTDIHWIVLYAWFRNERGPNPAFLRMARATTSDEKYLYRIGEKIRNEMSREMSDLSPLGFRYALSDGTLHDIVERFVRRKAWYGEWPSK